MGCRGGCLAAGLVCTVVRNYCLGVCEALLAGSGRGVVGAGSPTPPPGVSPFTRAP